VRLSRDAGLLNRVVNDPSVHPRVSYGLGQMDLSAAVLDPQNIFIANEHGGFLFVRDGAVFEVHTQFLPAGRGPEVLEAGREALAYIFTRTDAIAVRTMVGDNEAAEKLARAAGFLPCGEGSINGHPVTVFALTIKQWAKGLDLCRLQQ
jgi:hypothetical protein